MAIVTKAIRNGKYENEDLFDSLDLYMKQLQTLISNLTNTTKPDTIDSTLPETVKDTIMLFTNSLTTK